MNNLLALVLELQSKKPLLDFDWFNEWMNEQANK